MILGHIFQGNILLMPLNVMFMIMLLDQGAKLCGIFRWSVSSDLQSEACTSCTARVCLDQHIHTFLRPYCSKVEYCAFLRANWITVMVKDSTVIESVINLKDLVPNAVFAS